MASASIVITAGRSEADDELLARLTAWSGRGWLQDFVWISVGGADASASLLISNGERKQLSLEDYLEGVDRLLRYVAVQLVPRGQVDPQLPVQSAAIADKIYLWSNASSQRLVRMGIIVPSSDTPVSSLPPTTMLSTFEANIVLSPEDRPGLRGFRIPMDAGDRFVSHAALGVASLSGLWRGCPTSPFDGRGDDAAAAPQRRAAFAAVSGARIVHGVLTVHDVTARLLEWTRELPSDPLVASDLFRSLPMRDEQRWLNALVPRALEALGQGELRRYQPPPGKRAVKPRRGIWSTVLHFLNFVWDRLRQAPNAAIERLVVRAEDAVQRAIPGEEAEYLVRLGSRARSEDIDVVPADDLVVAARSALAAVAPDAPLVDIARPSLWRDLRMLCFGLVDGGEVPSGIMAPEEGKKRLVPSRHAIAPDPFANAESLADMLGVGGPPESPLTEPLRLVDPRQLDLLRRWAEEAQPARATAPGTVEDASPIEGITTLIDGIRSSREKALLWKLASGLSAELDAALEGAQAASDRIKRASTDLQRDKQAILKEPRLLRWTRRISTGLFGFLAVAPLAIHLLWSLLGPNWLKDLLAGREFWGISIWSGIDFSLTSFYGFLWPLLWRASLLPIATRIWSWVSNVRRQYKILVRFDGLPAKLERETELLRFEISEVHRLSSIYARFVDWCEAIAWPLHRPYGDLEAAGGPPSFEPHHEEPLPRALRVVDATASAVRVSQLAGSLARRLLPPGFLTTAFEQSARDLIAGVRAAFGGTTDQVIESLDNSIGGVEVQRFTEAVATPEFARRQAEMFRGRVAEALASHTPEKLFDSWEEMAAPDAVERVGRERLEMATFLSELLESDEEEGRPRNGIGDGVHLWAERASVEASRPASTYVWAIGAMGAEARGEDMHRIDAEASATADGSLLFLAVRVDLTQEVEPESFALFAPGDGRRQLGESVEPTPWA